MHDCEILEKNRMRTQRKTRRETDGENAVTEMIKPQSKLR